MRAAFCTFCDDIREEVSGKLLVIGAYVGEMVLESLPATVNRLSLIIDIAERKDIYVGAERVIVTLPDGEVLERPLRLNEDATTLAALKDDAEIVNIIDRVYLNLDRVLLSASGRLKVDVLVGGERLRAGSLKIRTRDA